MSIVVTTDVFCDGEDCGQWTHGCVGPTQNAKKARKNASRTGTGSREEAPWGYKQGKDLCPECQEKL